MRTADAERMVKEERRTTILSVNAVLRDVMRGGKLVRRGALVQDTAVAAVRVILARLYVRDGLTKQEAWEKVRKVK